jgi:hypothetical protein
LRSVVFDCTASPVELTGQVLYNIGTMGSSSDYSSGRVGRYLFAGEHLWNKYFVTFDCTGAPSRTGLQKATLSLWQQATDDAGNPNYQVGAGDKVKVDHLVFTTLSYDSWATAALDSPGSIAPTQSSAYQTLDVTTASGADLTAGRSRTQFRLDVPVASGDNGSHWLEYDTASGIHEPKLQLHFLIP